MYRKLFLSLLLCLTLTTPARAANDSSTIELPASFEKGDFYFDSLVEVDKEPQDYFIRKGKKVIHIKSSLPVYKYKVSDSNELIPLVNYKIPGVKDTRPQSVQHPRLAKICKGLAVIGSVGGGLSYLLGLLL